MTKSLDFSKPLVLISGKSRYPARVICTDRKGAFPVVILYTSSSGSEHPVSFRSDGIFESMRLENVPERTSTFLNVWTKGYTYNTYDSLEAAQHYAGKSRGGGWTGATVEVIHEDGVPVDSKLHFYEESTA